MNKMKNYSRMWLIPLLLVMIMAGCEDRVGITSPPVITIPTVSSTNPINAATGVPFNQKITATFSEAMNSSTVTTATFTLMQGTSFVSGTVSYTGTTATFSPSSNLAPNTTYTATITTGAKNIAGGALANNYVWSFTTGAAAAVTLPTVSSTDPANAATGVALNQKIAATFSVAMDATTIQTSTFSLMQGTTSVSGFVSYSGITAIFAPASNLAPNTAYTVTIKTGAKDLAGNALANNYIWSFTTGAAAVVTPPTVSSTDPANAATGVALNQKIAATFSKTMDATTITTSTFTLMQGTTPISGFVSYSGATAIFAPTSNLVANTVYTATITTGAKDLAGNALANNYVWSFTTGAAVVVTPPTVISTIPANAAAGVPFNQKIAATFSKTMDATTITTSTFTLMQGTTPISGFVSYSGATAIFAPTSNLVANTVYTATITTGAKDLAGNALANNYVWNFTTGIGAVSNPPTVISTDPVSAAICVALNKQVTATFSKTMDASTITTAIFTIMETQGATFVSGTVSYANKIATFKPLINLKPNTMYTGTITTGAKDSTGNSMTSNYVWNFTTVIPYTVTLSANPLAGGIISGGGTFNSCSLVTVTATPNAGYTFTNWTEGATVVSTNANYTFTLNGNRTLVANFAINTYTLTVTSVNGTVTKNPNQTNYDHGSNVILTATPNAGYTFTGWSGDATGSTNPLTVTMNSNKNITANFTAIQYTVSLSSNPAAGGNTSGGGTFNSGSSVTVTATANAGFSFTNWTESGIAVSTNASYTFTISGNRTLVANFGLAGAVGQAPVNLGTAARFAILSDQAITNIPTSAITGDVGISPGLRASITGFVLTPDVTNTFSTSPEVTGKVFAADDAVPTPAMLTAAKSDALAAYLDATAAVRGIPTPLSGNINGLTLVPGLYQSGTSIEISPGGIVYLDGQGDVNAVFVIRSATSITTQSTSEVRLTNGAQAKNIYWSAGSAATLGTNSKMKGTIIASTSISLLTGARLDGRALIQGPAAGQVSLDQNIIVKP